MSENVCTLGESLQPKVEIKAGKPCRALLLDDIKSATDDFSDEHLIGRGGFGKVYKGLIDDGSQIVAIKRLDSISKQGKREFLTEIETLTELRHDNLVALIGYCHECGEMILVYEYVALGTLADHLFGSKKTDSPLSWIERLDICIGAGRGLDYLHTGRSMIHRDVKATNILLDENYTAKVADFGLAKHLMSSKSETHVTTIVKGTLGYLDPYYFQMGQLAVKSDTYAFGVMLLETLTGRSVNNPGLGEDEPGLIFWAKKKIRKGKSREIVDTCLSTEICNDSLRIFLDVVERCLDLEPKRRPTMSQVVLRLEVALKKQKGAMKQKAPWIWTWIVDRPTRKTETLVPDELPGVQQFSLQQLKDITENFTEITYDRPWYNGFLERGQVVAVMLAYTEDLRKVSVFQSLKHPNIAQLIGYSVDDNHIVNYLVHELATDICLADILGRLSWAQRVKIAIESAKGLEYIHQNKQAHIGMTPWNILILDDDNVSWVAGLGSYGRNTSFDGDRKKDYYDTCFQAGPYFPTEKSDIYCFGVILVELISGRLVSAPNRMRIRGANLVYWNFVSSRDKTHVLVDPRLKGAYQLQAAKLMGHLALTCLHDFPKMEWVVKELQQAYDLSVGKNECHDAV